jgi:hypothetical protein
MNRYSKWFVHSRTLRLNALAAALIVLDAKFQIVQPLLGAHYGPLVGLGLTVANAYLRTITTQPLSAARPTP